MIQVLQQGIMDSVQDTGRYGYQHLGINPGGAMDRAALAVANSLVGNELGEAAIELHFPASAFLFEENVLIALSGADFGAMINERPVSINKPFFITSQTVLRFTRPVWGARCYMAIQGGLELPHWLDSHSTHLKAGAGGLEGRVLQKYDRLSFRRNTIQLKTEMPLPWTADVRELYTPGNVIRVTTGSGWELLDKAGQASFGGDFHLTEQSDRMGFRLQGSPIHTIPYEEMLSAGISRGTVQLLPNGQLIILVADHQTTGGYPRIAHVIAADQPTLAQFSPRHHFSFHVIDPEIARELLWQQEQRLLFLQNACKLRLEEWLHSKGLSTN